MLSCQNLFNFILNCKIKSNRLNCNNEKELYKIFNWKVLLFYCVRKNIYIFLGAIGFPTMQWILNAISLFIPEVLSKSNDVSNNPKVCIFLLGSWITKLIPLETFGNEIHKIRIIRTLKSNFHCFTFWNYLLFSYLNKFSILVEINWWIFGVLILK